MEVGDPTRSDCLTSSVLVGQPHCTVTVQCASPPEMNRIEEIIRDILHDRGLTKQCDAVEGLARRLISFYQGGVHDGGALKFLTGLDEKWALAPSARRNCLHLDATSEG